MHNCMHIVTVKLFFKTQGKDTMTRHQQNIVKTTRAHMRQLCAVEVFDVWHAKQVSNAQLHAHCDSETFF